MHACRAMGYFLPHLDTIGLRVIKVKILAEDDALANGDTHHYQLRRTWTFMLGRLPLMQDEEFGELDDLCLRLDSSAASFVELVQTIFPQSLGPWVIVEGLSHDWIGALLHSLEAHFPGLGETDYFTQNFSNCVEIKHAAESLEAAASVLRSRPELLDETLNGAVKMAEGFDSLWSGFNDTLEGSLLTFSK